MKLFMRLMLICIVLVAISFTNDLSAQPPDPGGGQGDPPGIPIDGGLSLLLAAGVAYGGKKVYDLNKESKE